MKKIIIFLGLHFYVIQYKSGRKYFKGKYYFMDIQGLSMNDFWTDKIITSCQAKVLKTEIY